MGLFRSIAGRTEQFVVWVDRSGFGGAVRALTYTLTAGWTLALDSDLIPDGGAKTYGFLACYVLLVLSAVFLHYSGAAARAEEVQRGKDAVRELERVEKGLTRSNATLAGVLEDLACQIDTDVGPRRSFLTDDECKAACIGLLARVQTLAQTALGAEADSLRLRATLAVPIREEGVVSALRVWCYDQPYDDRRRTTLQMEWEGAPEAFRRRAFASISDIHALGYLPGAEARRFRSVACYPVRAVGGQQEPLAVVNLDIEPADFFTLERTSRLNTYIQPAVQAIGIPLASRRNGPFPFSA